MRLVIDVDTDNPIHHAEGTDYFIPDLHTYVSENMLKILKKKGKVLPKDHGRLIDADKTLEAAWQKFYKHEEEWEEKDENYLPLHRFYDQNGFECCQQTIVNAPTIIEADKED